MRFSDIVSTLILNLKFTNFLMLFNAYCDTSPSLVSQFCICVLLFPILSSFHLFISSIIHCMHNFNVVCGAVYVIDLRSSKSFTHLVLIVLAVSLNSP